MNRFPIALCCLLLTAQASQAAVIQSGPAYLTNVSTAPNLVVNNDDYVGAFADNPNKAQINSQTPRQSIGSIERIIPTTSSGGITEYAVSVGGTASRDNLDLNGIFQLQVGFGTGQNFVPASLVAPGLRFDTSANVNPPVPDVRLGFPGPIPLLRLLQHEDDTLTFQGNSMTDFGNLVNYASQEIFKFPLDVPDLNESLRDQFYSPAELAGLPPGTVPFTIRTTVVPEPSGVMLMFTGVVGVLIASVVALKRRNWRERH
jgi:hypothetical protein